MEKRLADANQTAAFLGIARSTFDALVRAGLPYHDTTLPGRQRRRLRFDLDEVKAWLKGRAPREPHQPAEPYGG